MPETRGRLSILACKSGGPFAEKVMAALKEKQAPVNWIETKRIQHPDSALNTQILDSIRGADLYIFQDVVNSQNDFSMQDNFFELLTAIDAARRSDVRHITAVIPTFPYSRQDKAYGREGETAKMAAMMMQTAGVDHVLTLDIHNTAITGFFTNPRVTCENLQASKNIIDYIKNSGEINLENIVASSCDEGGIKRAEHYAAKLGVRYVSVAKSRAGPGLVRKIQILGDVKNKDVLVVDDMIDTAGTLKRVVSVMRQAGAKRIYAACSLPIFSGKGVERIRSLYEAGDLKSVIGTDAIYHGEDFLKASPWFREVSVASYFSKIIHNMNCCESISDLLK